MKVLLRADASGEIGAGHVMRQIALAEELLFRGVETFLVGEVLGMSWLEDKILSVRGLKRISQPIGTFDSRILRELDASVSAIDSYALEQDELVKWESQIARTIVFVDGPWQRLSGNLAVAPSLRDELTWFGDLRKRFVRVNSGPDYLTIRTEIKKVKQLRLREPKGPTQILVVLGGSDPRGLTPVIESALQELAKEHRVVTIGNVATIASSGASLPSRRQVVHLPRSCFVEQLIKSTIVISGAGTASGELLFLGIPSIFIPVTDNQIENARALEHLYSSFVVWPDSSDFEQELVGMVADLLARRPTRGTADAQSPVVDGLGAQRIADLITDRP